MASVEAIISGVYSNPDVAAVGAIAGFIIAKAMDRRKRRRNGFGGGGFP